MAEKILVVEDDRAILDGLGAALAAEGYEVECVPDGRTGLDRARAGAPSLLILDIMLPGMSGFEVAKKLRDEGRQVPIILLTARGEEDDRVLGLELGADDYVTKPFSLRELMARVRSILRRAQPATPRSRPSYGFGDVTVDFRGQEVRKAGRSVELSAREFRILTCFIDHAGDALQNGIVQVVLAQHGVKRAVSPVVGEPHARNIKRLCPFRQRFVSSRNEQEFGCWIEISRDEPGAGHAVHAHLLPGNPLHEANPPLALIRRARTSWPSSEWK